MTNVQNNGSTVSKQDSTLLKHDSGYVGLGTIVVLVKNGMDGALANAFVELVTTTGGLRAQITPILGSVTFDNVPFGFFILRVTSGSAQLQLSGSVQSELPLSETFNF